MDEYILLFRHQDGNKIASPEQIGIWMKQTQDWIAGIAAKNKFVSGTGLPFEDAHVVSNKNGHQVVTAGAHGNIHETVGGFVIVQADSVEEAVQFAKGAPVLQGEGNSVEVRKIARSSGETK